MKNLIKKLLNEETNKMMLLEELSMLIEKELAVGPGLKKKLNNINKPFADKLLQFLSSDNIPDKVTIDSIDYTSDDDKTLTGYFKDREGNSKARKFKVGKLLTYVGLPKNEFKGYEIEELIAHLKKGTTEDFKVVDGEDILKAYHCENYDEGETMGSCMRYASAQSYLKIYTDNPNEVKCLVLLNPNNGKVRGRALIWHMDNDQYFMDRVYVTNNSYRNLFNIYKEENNISGRANSTVTLENGGEYDEYPYMDTFEYYSPSNSELSSGADHEDSIRLQDTSGGHVPAGVYIEYGDHEGETVDEDEAYYLSYRTPSGYIEGWAHQDDIIPVDGDVYLTDDCIKTYDGEWVFRYGDDYVVELTAGRFEDEYAKHDDAIELEPNHYGNNEYITREDDYIELDDDIYDVPYAFTDDTLDTYNSKTILRDDAIRLYEPHYGDTAYAHPEDCTEVDIKDHGEAWVLDDDLDEFEENGLIDEMRQAIMENKKFLKKLVREGISKHLEEAKDSKHALERVKNRIQKMSDVDMNPATKARILNNLQTVRMTDFPMGESFIILLGGFKVNPESPLYIKVKNREYYRINDLTNKDSTGDQIWAVIRDNKVVTVMLRKKIQSTDVDYLKTMNRVDNVIFNIDKYLKEKKQ